MHFRKIIIDFDKGVGYDPWAMLTGHVDNKRSFANFVNFIYTCGKDICTMS